MRIKQLLPLFVAASIASSANAALTALLDDISAVFTTSDDPSGSVSNLKNEGETLANVDIGVQYGGAHLSPLALTRICMEATPSTPTRLF